MEESGTLRPAYSKLHTIVCKFAYLTVMIFSAFSFKGGGRGQTIGEFYVLDGLLPMSNNLYNFY